MLIEKLTVNYGKDAVLYLELYSLDTPTDELKFGDSTTTDTGEVLVWYGHDENPENISGWSSTKWNNLGISNAVVTHVISSRAPDNKFIYRVLNNDIYFDEEKYLSNSTEGTIK